MSRFARFNWAVLAAAFFASQPGLCQVPSNFWFGTNSMVHDSSGNLFAAGHTTGFPATRGAYQFQHTPALCSVYNDPHLEYSCGTGFVAKFSPTGTMIWGTYLGAPVDEGDSVSYVALDSQGNVWVSGTAGGSFPTTPNAYDPAGPPRGFLPTAGFLAELSPDGSQLLYSTFSDASLGLVDAQGNVVYLFGDGVIKFVPASNDGFRSTLQGFVGILGWVAFLDGSGVVYLAGSSNDPSFPITPGVYSHPSQGYDVVLVAIDPSGNILFSTKIGGSGDDFLTSVTRDAEGNFYLAGGDSVYFPFGPGSPDFPLTHDAAQTVPSAVGTAFIVKLSADASTLLYSSYLGAQFEEMKIGGDGKVSGLAENFEARTPDGYQPCSPSPLDYVRLTANQPAIEYSTGTPAAPFDFDTSGNVYITNYPVESPYFKTLDVSTAPHSGPVCMAESASLYETTFAPGLLVSIFGPGVGPDQPTPLALDASGRVATQLAGTEVLFDGIPAPILWAALARVDVVVPFGVQASASDSTTVSVLRNGESVGTLTNDLAPRSLWLYTTNGMGTGVAAWNQDGTPNSAQNPAKVGDILTFYGSGAGPMTPTPIDGTIAQSPQSRLPGFTLGTGVFSCPVFYAGDAPGQVAGIVQINCEVTVSGYNGPVTFSTGGSYTSPEYGIVNMFQMSYQIYVAP